MVQPQRDPLGGAPDPALTAFSGLWSSAAVLQCASAILHYPHILSQQLGVHARPPAAGPEDLAALPSNTKIDDHSLRHTIANEVPLFTPTPPNGISPPGTADVSITTLENVDDPTNPAGLGAEGLTTRTLSSRFVQSTTLDHPHHLRPVQTPEASKSTPDISKLIWKSKSLLSGAHLTSPSMNNQMPTLQAQQHLKPRCVDPAIVLGIHFLDLAHQPAAQKFKVLGRTLGADHYHTDTASNTAPNSDKIKAAAKLLLKVLETWERLQGCLPSTRLSDYLLGGGGHGSDAAVALASELLRQVEDLYLLCESEPDLRDLPADPEAARQARLCRLFGETPERMQARFDLLRSCSAGRPEAAPGATAGDVEEVLLALQGTAPPSARFSAQLCGALLAEPEAAAATPPPSPPRAAKTPAAKGMLRRSGSATGVAAEADAMRRLLHAIAAPLAHPVASHRPPSEEAAARRAVDAEEDSALLSMLNIPFVLLTLWGRKGQSPVDSRDAGGGSGDTSPLPLRHHGGAAVEQKDGEDQQPECATHPQALLLTASVPSGHRMTDIGLQQGHSFCPGASSLFLPQARPVEFSLSRATSSCMEEPQRISNMASAREAPSTSSMRSSSIASRLTHRHHGGSPYTLGGPVRHLGSTHRPLPEGHPSMLRENQLLRQPSSSAMDGDSTAARQQQTLSSVGRTLMPGGRLPNPAGETTTIPFDQNAAPLPARPPFATTPSPAPENNYRLQRTMDGFSNTDGAPPQSRDAAALLPDPGTPSGLAGPPAAPQDAASNTLSGAPAVERANASAEWLLGLQEGEGLSRFRFFAPVEGGSDDTEEACGSVAWFHAIAAALPQQDGPAAAVEWLRAHAGLDEVLVTRHPGDEKEDLLAAVARCANLSYVSPTDLTPGIPCISAPLVLQDVALGAFYGIRLITDSTPPLPTIVKDCAYVAIVMEHLLCRGQRFHSPHPSSHQDTGLFVSQPVSRSPQPPSRPPDMNSSQASNSLVKRLVKNSRRKTTSMARKKKEGEQQPSSTSREGAEEGTNSEHTVISTPLDHPEHNPKDALTGPFLTPLVITSTERPGEVAEPAASASSPIEGKDSPEYHQSPTRRGATAAPAFASDSGQGVASCPVLSGSWAMQRPGKVLWVEGEHAPTMSAEELSNALPKKENSASHSTGGKNTSQQPSEEGGKSPPQIFPWNESGGVGATQRGAARRKSSCFSFFRDAHSRSSITASARQLTLLHEINSVRMGLLHQRLTPGNPISSICIADDVPPVIYIHDMLLQQVINSFFTNDSRRRGSWSTVSSMYHAFVNVCEMYIVVDLLRADNVPGEDPGELYIQRLQKFYIDCEAQYQELFTPAPAKVISDRVWRDELAGRPRWIDGVLLRAERLFRPLESPTAELVSDKASGENLKHSYSSPPEWQRRPVRSHSILPLNSISSPMDLSPTGAESDMNMGATPLHPERLPEVWAVQDAACAGPKAVVDLAADFLEPVRQLLAEIGGVVVATSAGTASIVLPYITQDRLDLLKEWRIVTRPFSAMAEMGIAAVNQLADEALIRKAYEEKEVGQTAPILNLHYEAAAEPFQELLGKDIHIPSIEEVNKAYAAAESLALEQSGVASGNTSSTQLTPAQSHFEKRAESAVSVRTTQDHRAGLVKIQPVLGLPLSLSSSGQNPNTSPAEKSATAAVSPRMPFMFKGGAAFEDAPGGISETQTFRSRMAADTSSSSAESPLLPPPFNDKMSTTPEDVIRSLTGLLSSSKLESDDAVVLPSAETEISAAEAEDNHITVEEDSNKSFIDFAALPPSKRGYVSRVDAPNFRILILNAEPCIMLLKWLIDLDHSVSFAVNTQHIRGFLLGGISVYDVVLIEWTASVMTPENMELLERVRQDNFAIPIFYCYTGPDVTPDITTPVGLSNRPHLPPDIHADHILYGKDLLECCVSRRSFIRSQIRLGRLLKDLRGDTTITYQITRRIGSGGFGDVYEVSLYASKGRLAMKRIPLGNVTLDRMDQLYKEVVIMRELDHRSIIHFSHITCDKTCLNIFMELCQCSLEDILAEGFQFAGTDLRHAGTQAISGCEFVSAQSSPKQLHHNSQKTTASSEFYGNNNNNMRSGSRSKLMHRPSTVVTPHAIEPTLIIRDVVSAVKYLHCFDIVHRDIKPQNILFLDGVAKLADFGSATTASKSQESLKTMKGTVPYMAPEVFLGEAYRKSCDIWSLGILFAELFGLHLAHFSLLHFPALQDFYKSIDFDESMPVVATNYVDIGFKKHFPDEFVEKVKEILEEARRVSAEERRLRFVEQETVRHSTSSQDSSQSPSIVSERTRTIFVVEVNTQDLNCTASQHQLPASLIELLEHTFHRCPGKRITAEQLLEHPMANKSEWLQKMFVEVEELNRCICAVAGTHDAAEEEKHLDLSFGSQSGDGGSGDDSW